MIIEAMQFGDLLRGNFHYLILHFLLFIILPCTVKRLFSLKYKPTGNLSRKYARVSAIVTTYNEDPKILENCLKSIEANNPYELIVAIDKPTKILEDIIRKYTDKIVISKERRGKRKALVEAVRMAKGDILVFSDSDVILKKNCIDELIKPFDDENICGVSTVHDIYPTGGGISAYLSWKYSQIIERNRQVNDNALNNNLVVIDGRCNAYRRSIFMKYLSDFENETYFGKPCQIGDDRYLTFRINADGGKAVIQNTAMVDTAAPDSLKGFIKQQLRWARSGRKFFLREIRTNLYSKVGWVYGLHSVTYYLSAVSFTVAILVDVMFFELPNLYLPLFAIPIFVLTGTTMVNIIRQKIMLGRKANISNSFWFGLIGLFILYPVNLYAWLTLHKQHVWLTRGEEI